MSPIAVVTIRFERSEYRVLENAGSVMVCLIKEPNTPGSVTIDNVQTVQNTATGMYISTISAIQWSVIEMNALAQVHFMICYEMNV